MRTINPADTKPTRTGHTPALGARPSSAPSAPPTGADPMIDAIVGELHGMIGSLRCAGTGRMVKAGISMTHLHILWVLEHHGEMTMSRLAEMLDVSFSNATGLIDRMEERGLIERVRVPDDRRVVIVRVSEQGARIRDEIETLKQDRMRSILARLEPDQLDRVLGALGDLRSAVVDEIGTDHLDAHVHHT
jgi:DNA-binding MarR family transcriptional regulator